jgi:hypothetical protein
MKKILFMLAIIATAFSQNSFGQDSTKTPSSQLLNTYYQLKDNLVKSSSPAAAISANDFVKAVNLTDKQIINDDVKAKLLADANAIARSKDIRQQRESFTGLSDNMFELAKTVKLSAEPVYQQYCPMKKASWLSNDKAIKNPYYGSAMLTCGSVKTIL